MGYSKGTWKVGNNNRVVVTDNSEGFRNPENGVGVSSGHSDVDYYGGYLICESVMKPADAKLIASAPKLLDALEDMMQSYEKYGHLLNYNVDAARALIKEVKS